LIIRNLKLGIRKNPSWESLPRLGGGKGGLIIYLSGYWVIRLIGYWELKPCRSGIYI